MLTVKLPLQNNEKVLSEELAFRVLGFPCVSGSAGNLAVTNQRVVYEPSVLCFFSSVVEIRLCDIESIVKASFLVFSPVVQITTKFQKESFSTTERFFFGSFAHANLISTITRATDHIPSY